MRSWGWWLVWVGLGGWVACGPALREGPVRFESRGVELTLEGYPLRGLPPVRSHFVATVRMPRATYTQYGGCFTEVWEFGDGGELRRERHCKEVAEFDERGWAVLEFFAEHAFYRPGTYEVLFKLKPSGLEDRALVWGRIRVAVLSQDGD